MNEPARLFICLSARALPSPGTHAWHVCPHVDLADLSGVMDIVNPQARRRIHQSCIVLLD